MFRVRVLVADTANLNQARTQVNQSYKAIQPAMANHGIDHSRQSAGYHGGHER